MTERVVQLTSGLTVAIEPMVSTRTASIGVWVGVGARDEPDELAGVSHFLEHLVFKGTRTRSAIDISRAVDRVGGDLNAFTAKEYTSYYCRVPARHAAGAVDLVADLVTRPALRDDDVASEREVILDELAMDDDSPEDVAHRTFARSLFDRHPLGRDTAGERATVSAITADDLRHFYARHYRAGSTVVAVAGAVDVDQTLTQIEQAFSDLPTGDGRATRDRPQSAEPTGPVHVSDDSEQVHLVTGGRALCRRDPDRPALDVVNHVLGGGLSSRLFDEVRERRGLAYSVFSTAVAYSDVGAWSIYAGSLPEHADELSDVVRAELDRLVADGVTTDELEIAQGYLCGSYEIGLEDSGARMSRLGGQLSQLGELVSVEEQLDRWSGVTLTDVERVIERVYGAAPPVSVLLGPH